MKIIKSGGHPEMCGGWSNTYIVELENEITVNDVINEIHKYQKKNNKNNESYGIYVNGDIFESTWIGERSKEELPSYKKMYKGNGNERVFKVRGEGGWYCGVSFYIDAEVYPTSTPNVATLKFSNVDYNSYNF